MILIELTLDSQEMYLSIAGTLAHRLVIHKLYSDTHIFDSIREQIAYINLDRYRKGKDRLWANIYADYPVPRTMPDSWVVVLNTADTIS